MLLTNKYTVMSFKPSSYQQAIYDEIVSGKNNLVVNAVAGSGKTTTLLHTLGLIPYTKNVIFLAFNKSIKEEIEHKVNALKLPNVKVSTCHGFGMTTLMRNLEVKPSIDNLKYRKLWRDIEDYHRDNKSTSLRTWNVATKMDMISQFNVNWNTVDDKSQYVKSVLQLADLGRMNLTTDVQSLTNLASKFGMHLQNGEAKLAFNMIEIASNKLSTIDFADMIYLPNRLNMQVENYDVVFVDECQDLNTAQRELMRNAIAPEDGRFVAVGDKNQAIYGFAGSDADSFIKLEKLPNTILLPLSVCYRCATDIINTAKTIVAQIEAREGAPFGQFNSNASVNDIMDGDMVLCRNTYPLVKLCLAFLKDGRKATIMGGDIGKALIRMVIDTKKSNMEDVFAQLHHDLGVTLKRIMRAKSCIESDARQTSEYDNAKERINVIEALYTDGMSVETLTVKLDSIFNDNSKEGILLSSIHKSKGLECDRVFIIHPEKMPSKFARQDWELVQEENLRYVAYTRAKSLLGIVGDFDAYSDQAEETFADKVSAVKASKHVGVLNGGKYRLEGVVKEVRHIPAYDTFVFTIEDKDGNIFEKWGDISSKYSISNNGGEITEGTLIKALVTVSKHTEFKGVKRNAIKNFAKFK